MYKQITSVQNTQIKNLLSLLEKSRQRKKEGLFVLEGVRELSLAVQGGYEIVEVYFESTLFDLSDLQNYHLKSSQLIKVSKEVYDKIAYRNTTEGVVALLKTKELSITQVKFVKKTPLVLVAEAPEKPGNIGALLRTADAANVDLVCIANPKTDMYNPNIIRSSVGCLFTNQLCIGTTQEIIDFLKSNSVQIFAAALKEESVYYHEQDFTTSTAIVVGTEAVGLSEEWLSQADQKIIIPMLGKIDSMNVSVAAGILIYEAKRQRNFKG